MINYNLELILKPIQLLKKILKYYYLKLVFLVASKTDFFYIINLQEEWGNNFRNSIL